jgi:hypothetical protein
VIGGKVPDHLPYLCIQLRDLPIRQFLTTVIQVPESASCDKKKRVMALHNPNRFRLGRGAQKLDGERRGIRISKPGFHGVGSATGRKSMIERLAHHQITARKPVLKDSFAYGGRQGQRPKVNCRQNPGAQQQSCKQRWFCDFHYCDSYYRTRGDNRQAPDLGSGRTGASESTGLGCLRPEREGRLAGWIWDRVQRHSLLGSRRYPQGDVFTREVTVSTPSLLTGCRPRCHRRN